MAGSVEKLKLGLLEKMDNVVSSRMEMDIAVSVLFLKYRRRIAVIAEKNEDHRLKVSGLVLCADSESFESDVIAGESSAAFLPVILLLLFDWGTPAAPGSVEDSAVPCIVGVIL